MELIFCKNSTIYYPRHNHVSVPTIGIILDGFVVLTCKYRFIRSFKAEVELTPHQFQIQNRIRKAQRLIHEADTITEVALTTGFCDQSHFIKQFEKQVGLSPLYSRAIKFTI